VPAIDRRSRDYVTACKEPVAKLEEDPETCHNLNGEIEILSPPGSYEADILRLVPLGPEEM
jgi:hypothetical protein